MFHPDFLCLVVNEKSIKSVEMVSPSNMQSKIQVLEEILKELSVTEMVEISGSRKKVSEFVQRFDEYFRVVCQTVDEREGQ